MESLVQLRLRRDSIWKYSRTHVYNLTNCPPIIKHKENNLENIMPMGWFPPSKPTPIPMNPNP